MDSSVWLPAALGMVGVVAGSLTSGQVQLRALKKQSEAAAVVRRDERRRDAYAKYLTEITTIRNQLMLLRVEMEENGITNEAVELLHVASDAQGAMLHAEVMLEIEASESIRGLIPEVKINFSDDLFEASDPDAMVAAVRNAQEQFRDANKKVIAIMRRDLYPEDL